jgi:hypothetical protein
VPQPIQNARAGQQLQQQFGLRGRHKFQLDDVIVPVAIVELEETSAISVGEFWENLFTPAAAGEVAALRFQGAPGWICQPLSVFVDPVAAQVFRITLQENTIFPVLTGTATSRGVRSQTPHGPGPVPVSRGTWALPALGDTVANLDVQAAGRRIDLTGWELGENEWLTIYGATVNANVDFSPIWTARRVE